MRPRITQLLLFELLCQDHSRLYLHLVNYRRPLLLLHPSNNNITINRHLLFLLRELTLFAMDTVFYVVCAGFVFG
jgi:hypothetical protein